MKRLVVILALVAAAVLLVVVLGPGGREDPGGASGGKAGGGEGRPGGTPSSTGQGPIKAGPRPASTVKSKPEPPKEPVVIENMVTLAETLNDEDGNVVEDLQVVGELIRAYTKYIGTGPEGGLNEEIVDCLRGNNPMKMILVGKDHAKINEAGQLVDRFGTPYYFHPVSGTEIEIRSAGPDGLLWSKDDVLLD